MVGGFGEDISDAIFNVLEGGELPFVFEFSFACSQFHTPNLLSGVGWVYVPDFEPECFSLFDCGFALVVDDGLSARHLADGDGFNLAATGDDGWFVGVLVRVFYLSPIGRDLGVTVTGHLLNVGLEVFGHEEVGGKVDPPNAFSQGGAIHICEGLVYAVLGAAVAIGG